MYILAQDHETIFSANAGVVTLEEVWANEGTKDKMLMGYVIYGYIGDKTEANRTTLGGFDVPEDAIQVMDEIYKMLKLGKGFYAIPEDVSEEDLEIAAEDDKS